MAKTFTRQKEIEIANKQLQEGFKSATKPHYKNTIKDIIHPDCITCTKGTTKHTKQCLNCPVC